MKRHWKKTYTSTDELLEDYNKSVPSIIRELYSDFTFAEMADTNTCQQHSDFLMHLESEWNRLESAGGEK